MKNGKKGNEESLDGNRQQNKEIGNNKDETLIEKNGLEREIIINQRLLRQKNEKEKANKERKIVLQGVFI